jgi:hypothetical protein
MNDVHLHLAVGVAVVGIVDSFAKDFVVERVIQGKGEYLVEDL